jgi:hypothetical protein
MRQLYPIGLSHKAQEITIGIERPSPAAGIQFNSGLIIAIEGRFSDTSTGHAKDKIYGLIPNPLDRNNLDGLARNDAAQLSAILDIFQNRHLPSAHLHRDRIGAALQSTRNAWSNSLKALQFLSDGR